MELALLGLTKLHNLSQAEIKRFVVCIFKLRHLSLLEFEALVWVGAVIRLSSLSSTVLTAESLRVIRGVFGLDRGVWRLDHLSLRNIVFEVVIESLVASFPYWRSKGSVRPWLFCSRTYLS